MRKRVVIEKSIQEDIQNVLDALGETSADVKNKVKSVLATHLSDLQERVYNAKDAMFEYVEEAEPYKVAGVSLIAGLIIGMLVRKCS